MSTDDVVPGEVLSERPAEAGTDVALPGHSPTLAAIAAHGNSSIGYGPGRGGPNWIRCRDGFRLSATAGWGMHCTPRPDWFNGIPRDYPGPYTELEVGFPTARPEPWAAWEPYCEDPERPTDTAYGFVPVELVAQLLAEHGGEAPGSAPSAWSPAPTTPSGALGA